MPNKYSLLNDRAEYIDQVLLNSNRRNKPVVAFMRVGCVRVLVASSLMTMVEYLNRHHLSIYLKYNTVWDRIRTRKIYIDDYVAIVPDTRKHIWDALPNWAKYPELAPGRLTTVNDGKTVFIRYREGREESYRSMVEASENHPDLGRANSLSYWFKRHPILCSDDAERLVFLRKNSSDRDALCYKLAMRTFGAVPNPCECEGAIDHPAMSILDILNELTPQHRKHALCRLLSDNWYMDTTNNVFYGHTSLWTTLIETCAVPEKYKRVLALPIASKSPPVTAIG